VQARRLAGLQQILVTYPAVLAGGFTVVQYDPGIGEWTSHFGLELNFNPPPCEQAYPKRHTAARPAPPANCTRAELAVGSGVRSAGRAPRPGGGEPGPPIDATPGRGNLPGDGPATQSPASTSGGGYDPLSMPILAGSTGGQQRLLGDQSWQWLLIGPLTG
jgi:phospholipid/cholesterol/gamma-HCH transport system substrate-binding protein